MHYALLIQSDESILESRTDDEMSGIMAQHAQLQSDLKQRGQYLGAVKLMGSESATTLRRGRSSDPVITDGPFATTKEVFLGFYIVECEGLGDATAYAKRLLDAGADSVEVRPVAWGETRELAPSESVNVMKARG